MRRMGIVWVGLVQAAVALAAPDLESWPRMSTRDTVLLRQQPVDYPDEARRQDLGEVRCRVDVFVKTSGKPAEVRPTDCPELFHESVISSVSKWRWSLPVVDGRRGPARLDLIVRFKVSRGSNGFSHLPPQQIKVPGEADEDDSEDNLDPRVVPIEMPQEGTVVVDGTQPWAFPTVPLAILEITEIAFPKRAVTSRIYDDSCDVRLVVDRKGRPTALEVGRCAEDFQREVEKAVASWRWEPPVLDGEAAEARVRFDVEFRALPDSYYEDELEERTEAP